MVEYLDNRYYVGQVFKYFDTFVFITAVDYINKMVSIRALNAGEITVPWNSMDIVVGDSLAQYKRYEGPEAELIRLLYG